MPIRCGLPETVYLTRPQLQAPCRSTGSAGIYRVLAGARLNSDAALDIVEATAPTARPITDWPAGFASCLTFCAAPLRAAPTGALRLPKPVFLGASVAASLPGALPALAPVLVLGLVT